MLDFQSISAHLQIIIAEKMDYLDQKEFQLASKHGKDIVSYTKHKASLEMVLTAFDTEEVFEFNFRKRYWSQFRNIRDLPCLKVTKLHIYGGFSPQVFTEINETAGFVRSGVFLEWDYAPISLALFQKLSEFFHVRRLFTKLIIDSSLFNEPKFQKIDSIDIRPKHVPDEVLLQLKSEYVVFRYKRCSNRLLVIANLFFQQWLHRRRTIKWFEIDACGGCLLIEKELLFLGLSVSVVREHEEHRGILKFWMRIVDSEVPGKHTWEKKTLGIGDIIFSIDRGDRKLLVFASTNGSTILAQEYDDLREVFYVDESIATSIEDEDDDLLSFLQ